MNGSECKEATEDESMSSSQSSDTVTSQELNTQTNLESIIGPLITKVKLLHESVHSNYKELKNCMSIQKTELGKLESSILTSQ